ncbi:MAG: transcriptional regulator [Clostridiales bacterium]|nr:transcriptional regulator [Clostridiales bacterium]
MNRVQFAMWLGIPYRTMQEWEIGRRLMPDYLLRLIAYKVNSEKRAGRLAKN